MTQRLVRESDQVCIVRQLKVADRYFTRLKGLIGVQDFVEGQGLLFPRCNSIHMWMMSIPIDVVFLKSIRLKSELKWKIISVHPALKPWKLLPVTSMSADEVLELPAGVAQKFNLHEGEVLCIAS